MSKTARQVANAVASWFRRQRQANGRTGPSSLFAAALIEPLANCYLAGLKAAKASDVEVAVAQAKMQAKELAMQLNESTRNMLANDRPLGEVFGSDRAALIGLDADNVARQRCVGLGAKERGSMLEWVTDGKPCPSCRKLAGKKRRPGKAFGMLKDGTPILQAPAHPSCRCKCVEVGR